MANSNPYLILTRVRNSVIKELRDIFSPANNVLVVPPFEYPYIESVAHSTLGFYGNPVNGNTVIIGASTLTFVIGAPVGLQVQIGATQQITLANFVARVNLNSVILLVSAAVNTIPNQVNITSTIPGSSANATVTSTTSPVLRWTSPTLREGGLFDFDNSKIFISDAVPQDYQAWPSIVVDTASASETRYLGPEDSYDAKNSANIVTTDVIFSSLVVVVTIKVYIIDDTLARDKIVDLIYNNMSTIRHQLAVNGIEMIDRTLPTETRLVQNQRVYIENHFVLRVYCEWTNSLAVTNVTGLTVTVPVYTDGMPIITSSLSASFAPGVQFVIDLVTSPTALTVESSYGMTNGNTIVQGLNSTTIVTIVDNNHLIVVNTAGFVPGIATNISINLPFNYIITASNSPTSYAATGLPAGLIVNGANGLISGIPTPAGTYYATISALNAAGAANQSLTLTVL